MNVIEKYFNFQTNYTEERWKWLKIPFIIFWFIIATYVLINTSNIIMPTSICKFIDCSVFISLASKITIIVVTSFFVILYILEKKMLLVTAVLSILSVLIFTMEDSQGIYNRNDILSGILIAQFLAYFVYFIRKSKEQLSKQRIFFSQQMIVAIYFLSGISKIISSGFLWFRNTEHFAVQVQKANMNKYIDFKDNFYIAKAENMTSFVLSNPNMTSTLLLFTLLIELFVVVTLFINKKWMVYYGILLLLLHLGIWLFMSIVITPIIVVNLVFFINIFYFLYVIVIQSYRKVKS